ncbi:DNA adenine methylase (plasmid) [Rhizobium leguminosarum]
MHEAKSSHPVIRWAGSKKRLLPEMLRCIPEFTGKYLEPFAGSACLFFKLSPAKASINDLNRDLIEFYSIISESSDEVYNQFSNIERSKNRYYEIRSTYADLTDAIQRASAFLYLNRNCFNGIYRVNKRGIFNVPFSDSRVAPYPTREDFNSAARLLAKTHLHTDDFEAFCHSNCDRGDFIYLDPPYYIPKVRIFREYNKTDFSEDDTYRLVSLLQEIDSRGAQFLLSYPKGDLTQILSETWSSREIKATRSIAGSALARRSETEVLIANYGLSHA